MNAATSSKKLTPAQKRALTNLAINGKRGCDSAVTMYSLVRMGFVTQYPSYRITDAGLNEARRLGIIAS